MKCANNNCTDRYKDSCIYDTPSSNLQCKNRTAGLMDVESLKPAMCGQCICYDICRETGFYEDCMECNDFYYKLSELIDSKIKEALK